MLACNEKFEFEGHVHSAGTPDSLSGLLVRRPGSVWRKRFSSVNVRLLSIVAKKTPSRENSSALGGGGLLACEPEVHPRPRGEEALRFPQVGTCRRLVKATRKPGGCKMSGRFSDWIRTSVGHREFCGSTGRGTRGPPQPPSLRRATAHSHRGQYFTSQSGAFTTGVTISINGRCQNN